MDITNDLEYLLTIVIPLYNEEGNLPRLEQELSDHLCKTAYPSTVLFVDDGSTDRSATLIEQICARNEAFHFIRLTKNSGLSTALKAGIDAVGTKYLGYIDADLQTTPADFDLLMEYADQYDLVTGIRGERKDGIIKRLSSRTANAIRRSVTHDGATDTGCPLKILATDTAKRIPFFKGMHRFLPALIKLQGGKVKELPVSHFMRIAGESKYHLWNRLLGPAADLIAFIWIRKRYIRYEIAKKG